MGAPEDYSALDAVEIADAIRSGLSSASEVLEAALARKAQVDPLLRSVSLDLGEQARATVASGLPEHGPLVGVPFLLKDLWVALAGTVTTNGSRLFDDHVPGYESEVVARFRRAGLVVIGKSNSPELGLNITTEPVLFGPTHNPWDLTRTSGGSSGGAAAAVAAGIVPVAHGSDGGGSIRIPASCCGVFGLKPTRGRTPSGPGLGEMWSGLSVEGVVSRSVRDSAVVLDHISGPSIGDPYWPPPLEGPLSSAATSAAPGRLRIAFSDKAASGASVDAACSRALGEAMHICADLGHDVAERTFQFDAEALGDAFRIISGANVLADLEDRWAALGRTPGDDSLEQATLRRAAFGRESRAADYATALRTLHRIGREAGAFFDDLDVYATPVLAKVPQPLGTFDADSSDVAEFQRRVWEYIPFTPVWNATGQPAMSVPLHWTPEGLPVGVQFIGRLGAERVLVSLAAQLERSSPWSWRYTGLHEALGRISSQDPPS